MLAIVVMAICANAQTIDNDYVRIELKGDRAVITQKNATANAAIAALVESVKAKDFVQDGDHSYASIYTGDPAKTGMKTVWYFVKDSRGYGLGYLDDAAGEDYVAYSNLADAKKSMIKIMRLHYKVYGTLDPL